MQKLEKRIATLEATSAPADGVTLIRCFVSPGHLDAGILRLCGDDGKLWTRQPDETEQALIDRATLEAKRTPWGAASLTAENVKVTHAEH